MSTGLIPQGFYDAAVTVVPDEDGDTTRFRFGKSNTGTLFVLVYFRILEGPWAGRTVPWWGYFGKESGKRTLQSLRYCGLKGNDVMKAEVQPMDQVVSISVEHNINPNDEQQRPRARVAWVNQAGGGAAMKLNTPLSKDELVRFSAQLISRLAAIGEVDAPRASASAPQSAGGDPGPQVEDDGGGRYDDDDIPF